MKFLIDAQLPPGLRRVFAAAGHDAIHTLDLPDQNASRDGILNNVSMAEQRVVVTKDTDFYYSHLLHGRTWKLVLLRTGNMGLKDTRQMFEQHLPAIGTRTGSAVSGLMGEAPAHNTGYTTNALNQHTARSNPGRIVLRGRAHPQASVQIDGSAPTLTRADGTWDYETAIDNTAGPVRRSVNITATRPDVGRNGGTVNTTQSGGRHIPPANETLAYDDDGNLLSDGHWHYTWDAENRLIRQEESLAILIQPPGSAVLQRRRLDFVHDAGGRRVSKTVSVAEGSGTVFVLKQRMVFVYDGWNMIAELDTTATPRLLRSYEWGMDLSGSFEGAGGVGGLLVLREHSSTTGAVSSSHAPLYDGNGNVMELFAFATSTLSARYEYTAFGETISVDGTTIADANPFRFSTKYQDAESGWYYYGFRYYSPELGRWASRDPIGEQGGVNLYGFVNNDPVNHWDYLGQFWTQNAPVPAGATLGYSDLISKQNGAGTCGKAHWQIAWSLSGANITGGVIAQQMSWSGWKQYCGKKAEYIKENYIKQTANALLGKQDLFPNKIYTEYWTVGKGGLQNQAIDNWYSGLEEACTKGEITITAEARYENGGGMPNDAVPGGHPFSLQLPSVPRHQWPQGTTQSNTEKRKMTIKWNCCDGSAKKTTVK